jgi:hypothetical protein
LVQVLHTYVTLHSSQVKVLKLTRMYLRVGALLVVIVGSLSAAFISICGSHIFQVVTVGVLKGYV